MRLHELNTGIWAALRRGARRRCSGRKPNPRAARCPVLRLTFTPAWDSEWAAIGLQEAFLLPPLQVLRVFPGPSTAGVTRYVGCLVHSHPFLAKLMLQCTFLAISRQLNPSCRRTTTCQRRSRSRALPQGAAQKKKHRNNQRKDAERARTRLRPCCDASISRSERDNSGYNLLHEPPTQA